jgi:DNA mismatch repair ATPase MutS
MIDRRAEYSSRIELLNRNTEKLRSRQKNLPLLRLILFLIFLYLGYRYMVPKAFGMGSVPAAATALLALSGFVLLSIYDSRLKRNMRELLIMTGINEAEVEALNGNQEAFGSGSEFIQPDHAYTHDLDIFGKGSLYPYLNRTSTIFGSQKLASFLSEAFRYSRDIEERQKSIRELSEMTELRQRMQLIFHDLPVSASDRTEMLEWLSAGESVRNLKLLRGLAYLLPAVTLICLGLSIAGIIAFPSVLIVLQLIIVFLYSRQTIKIHATITSKTKILNRYARGLNQIETTSFTSGYLRELQSGLMKNGTKRPSEEIHRLSVILKYMDSNLNLLVSILLNGLFMFNLHLLLKAEAWKKTNRDSVTLWFEAIGEFDALSSLGNYAYNHPGHAYPEMEAGAFGFSATGLGHPLLSAANRVVNDLNISGWNQYIIITGANMAGKSTFLRTVGVNLILAMAGAPVCAERMRFSPVQIHSSIRTSDSLSKNESYFYAELKRLKQIIDDLEQGQQKFILLDEILKGTNSADKQSGSIALIKQLLRYKSVGMFATHDLALGDLAGLYPDSVSNKCFEISIEGNQMRIDYKLHDGVCKNLNATYLMKNMGILLES